MDSGRRIELDLAPGEDDLLSCYLTRFTALAGIAAPAASSPPRCAASFGRRAWFVARSPPFPPLLAAGRHSAQRICRMLRGQTTTHSPLAATVMAALQAHGVEQLQEEPNLWLIIDGSDLRKPHAREMAHLPLVQRLDYRGSNASTERARSSATPRST